MLTCVASCVCFDVCDLGVFAVCVVMRVFSCALMRVFSYVCSLKICPQMCTFDSFAYIRHHVLTYTVYIYSVIACVCVFHFAGNGE